MSDLRQPDEMSNPQHPPKAENTRDGRPLRPEHIRAVRLGHGANCSSVGSVIDTLFLGAAVGGAVFAAVCAAMRDEPVRVVGVTADDQRQADDGDARDDAEP